MSPFNWFDLSWPWIGLAGAVVIWVPLLGTNLLRSDLSIPRWLDLYWLSWVAPAPPPTHGPWRLRIFITNAPSHIGAALFSGHYNPGLVTAVIIQIPFSLWASYAAPRSCKVSWAGVASIVIGEIILSGVLFGSLKFFVDGHVSDFWMVTIQVLNPLWLLIFPRLEEQHERRRSIA